VYEEAQGFHPGPRVNVKLTSSHLGSTRTQAQTLKNICVGMGAADLRRAASGVEAACRNRLPDHPFPPPMLHALQNHMKLVQSKIENFSMEFRAGPTRHSRSSI